MINIQWVRAYRGRVWHLGFNVLGEAVFTACDSAGPWQDHLTGNPPSGARICERCDAATVEIRELMAEAVARQAPPAHSEDGDRPVQKDAEPLTSGAPNPRL